MERLFHLLVVPAAGDCAEHEIPGINHSLDLHVADRPDLRWAGVHHPQLFGGDVTVLPDAGRVHDHVFSPEEAGESPLP